MNKFRTALATLLVGGVTAQAATFTGARDDFRDETIYFAMTTRFYDGDPTNNTYCWDGNLNVNDPEWRGDFKGLIAKLDYIKALGFTAVWLTPVVENASGLDYHGYHAFNFSKVDPRYESDDCTFQDLIDAAHARGMKVILDIVLNHTGNFGEDHLCPMFVKDYSQNLSNIYKSMKLHPNSVLPDDYDLASPTAHTPRINALKNEDGVNHDSHNHYHHVGNEWNWDDYSRWYAQIAGDCVDLNTENPAVTEYLVDCYGKFIAMGVDGFRIDTSGHISRLTFNKAFIPQFTALAEQHKDRRGGGPFFMFGEVCARDRNVTYRNHQNCSPYFYTWKETRDYPWDYSTTSWDNVVNVNHGHGDHINITSQDRQGTDYHGDVDSRTPVSDNALLRGNEYHTPDRSQYSGLSVIDFPMHWNFRTTAEAWGVRSGDRYYNDASYNVTYVDSHDYAPDGAPENQRFAQPQSTWASNLDLMFTFRGIPCLYYGSEIEFRKGSTIDKGALLALRDSGRAYFGGYIEGDVTVNDFADYTGATGNMAATLSHPLALHIQRLNLLRAAIPALRKGQYSTEGCKGKIAFKRRYTDTATDSYALVTIGGPATFTGILNGTYTDAITGDTQTVTTGTLTASCTGDGNMRVYVLSTALTPAPGKVGRDGKYLYDKTPAPDTQSGYDGNEEPEDRVTVKDTAQGGGGISDDERDRLDRNPVTPAMSQGEQGAFFECGWSTVSAWVWNSSANYTGGSWPGAKCTYLGNNVWKWTYTGSHKITGANIIFNNSGQGTQTEDLTFVNGGYYKDNALVKVIDGAGEIPDTPAPDTRTYTVWYDNTDTGWPTVMTWIWSPAQNYTGGTWPGAAMTPDNVSGYHRYTFEAAADESDLQVIFSDGSGTQTADLPLHDNGIYTLGGFTGRYNTSVDHVTLPGTHIHTDGGAIIIDTDTPVTVTVASLTGIVRRIDAPAGRTTLRLPRGIYIAGGVKLIL